MKVTGIKIEINYEESEQDGFVLFTKPETIKDILETESFIKEACKVIFENEKQDQPGITFILDKTNDKR